MLLLFFFVIEDSGLKMVHHCPRSASDDRKGLFAYRGQVKLFSVANDQSFNNVRNNSGLLVFDIAVKSHRLIEIRRTAGKLSSWFGTFSCITTSGVLSLDS